MMSAGLLLTLAWMTAAPQDPVRTVTVDPGVRLQTWEGWGTSLCWWANVVGGLPDKVRKDAVKRVFKDLGLTVARFNIGGGENPGHTHMERRANMPGYLTEAGKWNWDADAGQRWVLLECRKLGVDKFEAFSNSPPYWMTLSGCASGGKDKKENLAPSKYGAFADYLAEVVKHYRDRYNIEFVTLDPMNEPGSFYWGEGGKQEGCQFDIGPHQSDLILKTDEALRKRGLKTRVCASDETNLDTAIRSWDALSLEARRIVYQINAHSYGGSSQVELRRRASIAGKRLWMSEYGDWDWSGVTMAKRIVRDVRLMKPTAWIYWQAVENWGNTWGLLFMDFYRDTKLVATKKYSAMAQFSRFVRPGSTFIEAGDENSLAAIRGRDLVLVYVCDRKPETVRFDLSAFESVGKVAGVWQTSASSDCAKLPDLPVSNEAFQTTLPPMSVTTFVVRASWDEVKHR